MSAADCIALRDVPHTSRLFLDYAEAGTTFPAGLRTLYAEAPQSDAWMRPVGEAINHADVRLVADLLEAQNRRWGASQATLENIARLRNGARAVVTGQQVSLFGGPLYSLLKAATAVQLAKQASERGVPHVPVFWLATEDHDFAEVNTASFVTAERQIKTLHLCDTPQAPVPVGGWVPGDCMQDSLTDAAAILGEGWAMDLLRECYAPDASLADAFARLFARLFADHGLILMDASSRDMHALAAPVLTYALQHASALHDALVERSAALVSDGYHAQVLVSDASGLLFLIDETDAQSGARVALRISGSSEFSAGGKKYSSQQLLQILQDTPERLSPNALLRPVMQDYLLPTAAYVGGPAEVAYFAQSEVLYRAILGAATPILPRLSATLLSPRIQRLLKRYELALPQAWTTPEELALRLGARSMPVELKTHLRDLGNAVEAELLALEEYAASLDEGLAHTAHVAGSKIRYQRNRLRRMMARFELERSTRLKEHAETLTAWLHPLGSLQERKLSGIQFVAEQGPGLIDRLVEEAADGCPGHKVIAL
jgi:bacillithiol biosynthesis cysteine-adding enzyme BshC